MARVLLVVLVAAFLITVASIVTLVPGLLLVAVLTWFSAPGLALALRLYRAPDIRQPDDNAAPSATSAWLAALMIGPAWGYVLSSLVLLGMWSAGIRGFGWLMLAPVPALLAIRPARALARY